MAVGTTMAVLGGISAGTKLLGGIFGNKAAKSAAELQAEAAKKAGQQIIDATGGVNTGITSAAGEAGKTALDAAGAAGARVSGDADRANNLLDPYRTAGDEATGELQRNLVAGGDFNKTPTLEDLQIDPGFAFRLAQGSKALEQSAAARGQATGGNALKALTGYSQGMASQEYQAAFNRFRQSADDRFNRLNTVSGRGQAAAGTEGSNLIDAGRYAGDKTFDATKYAGDRTYDASVTTGANTINAERIRGGYDTDAAAATAAGKVAGSNALWGGISGAANTGLETLLLNRPINKLAGGYDPAGTRSNPDGSITVRRRP